MPIESIEIEKTAEKFEKGAGNPTESRYTDRAKEILIDLDLGSCIHIKGLTQSEIKTMRVILYREAKLMGMNIQTTLDNDILKLYY